MPCGCLGHFDNLDLCEYPKVAAQLEAAQARVKELEEAQSRTAAELRQAWKASTEARGLPSSKRIFDAPLIALALFIAEAANTSKKDQGKPGSTEEPQ
jgi:hypothetical protein